MEKAPVDLPPPPPLPSGGIGGGKHGPGSKGPTASGGDGKGERVADLVPVRRPGLGSKGRPVKVIVNFFPVSFTPPTLPVVQYQVEFRRGDFEFPMKRETEGRELFALVVQQNQDVFHNVAYAYDGKKGLFTLGVLRIESPREFEVDTSALDGRGARRRNEEEEPPQRRRRVETLKATLTQTGLQANLADVANYVGWGGRQRQGGPPPPVEPRDALRALDIALRTATNARFMTVKDSFFFRRNDPGFAALHSRGVMDLQGGLEAWSGYKGVFRAVNGRLALNLDVVTAAIVKPMPMLQFVAEVLGSRGRPPQMLSDADRVRVRKMLKGLKVRTTHLQRNETRPVFDLTRDPASSAMFKLRDGTELSVAQHFASRQHTLSFPGLPCLDVGRRNRPTWWPMEVCEIVDAQTYLKKLSPQQIATLGRGRLPPSDRCRILGQAVHQSGMDRDGVLQSFGVSVGTQMMTVNARVLTPPALLYGGGVWEAPRNGQWNMNNKVMFEPSAVTRWSFVCLDPYAVRLRGDDECVGIAKLLAKCCSNKGMSLPETPSALQVVVVQSQGRAPPEARLAQAFEQLESHRPELVVWLLESKNSPYYAPIKKRCETVIGVVTQCIVKDQRRDFNDQYMTNVALKINIKMGKKNWVLRDISPDAPPTVRAIQEKPTMVIGLDVSHGAPGSVTSPSVAAVVGSTDISVSRFTSAARAQRRTEETIQGLFESSGEDAEPRGMICEILAAFGEENRCGPQRLIVYRDGVSESQFAPVGGQEIAQIRKACSAMGRKVGDPTYMPQITYIVAQKRNNTRIFPEHMRPGKPAEQNPIPGTVIDTDICHPFFFDFYLNSHQGIIGSSRPVHYHVLHDDCNFSADELQELTNHLCHSYARCTRAVSTVAPVFYAHLLAQRCRKYIHGEDSDSASDTTGTGGRGGRGGQLEEMPQFVASLRKSMFFC